jgi:hypothetical protein
LLYVHSSQCTVLSTFNEHGIRSNYHIIFSDKYCHTRCIRCTSDVKLCSCIPRKGFPVSGERCPVPWWVFIGFSHSRHCCPPPRIFICGSISHSAPSVALDASPTHRVDHRYYFIGLCGPGTTNHNSLKLWDLPMERIELRILLRLDC